MHKKRTPSLPYTCAATASLSVLILSSCGTQEEVEDSSSSGQITVLGYSGVVEDNYTEAVIEPFMEEYPDIEVDYVPGASAAEMLGTLRSEQSNPTNDVAIFDISIANTANNEGVFEELDPELVPNMEDIGESESEIEGNFGPPVTNDNLVLIYNQEELDEEPTSWDELWNEEYSGDVVIEAAPDLQGIGLMVLLSELEGADYQETIDPGISRLAELAPAVQSWTPSPDAYTMVNDGTGSIGIGWNARGQYFSEEPDSNLGVVTPEEGSLAQTNSINLVSESDSPLAAQTFIDYALSPEAQQSFSEAMYYAPTNEEVQLSEEVAERTAETPERVERAIEVDWNYIAEHNEEWTEVWRREILGG